MKKVAKLADITIILVCFVLFELIIRTTAPLVSGNVKQISEISSVTENLAKTKPAVLFLGNSLIDNALNLNSLQKQANLKMSSYKVVADSTSLWDWSCIVKNSFIDKNSLPDIVVIGYAWKQVGPVPHRLGGFFCGITDLPELIRQGMSSSSDVLDFLVSKLSKSYAMHETIRKRILDSIIPNYRLYTRVINNERNKTRKINYTNKKSEDYRLLNAYLKMLSTHNIKSIIVLMPVIDRYTLDEKFFSVASRNGSIILDYRELDDIDNDMFRDPIHLNERGNKIFTYHLAVDLKDI